MTASLLTARPAEITFSRHAVPYQPARHVWVDGIRFTTRRIVGFIRPGQLWYDAQHAYAMLVTSVDLDHGRVQLRKGLRGNGSIVNLDARRMVGIVPKARGRYFLLEDPQCGTPVPHYACPSCGTLVRARPHAARALLSCGCDREPVRIYTRDELDRALADVVSESGKTDRVFTAKQANLMAERAYQDGLRDAANRRR
ncbi:hypothetical protein GKE82_23855 [Conexibacter sp. W3-3-2]|uniref:zinc ribbon domain-containing protein n=1 Tax=Conexibacter sp. W3-3-2 TaxID=2675227 RepID=UPI0012B6B3E8|nr:zinc ribbon domain-containing protein [Conexibacter sp. W3-3-2]MTD47242.1 hypothetical protein [Conexibacter sp. W3-3-2]